MKEDVYVMTLRYIFPILQIFFKYYLKIRIYVIFEDWNKSKKEKRKEGRKEEGKAPTIKEKKILAEIAAAQHSPPKF